MRPNLFCELQQKSAVDTGWGDGPEDEWERVRDVWLKLVPANGEEYEQTQQMKSKATHTATSQYFSGADTSMRLVGDGRTFHIDSVLDEMNRHKFLNWRLVEVV